jgi:hypothetical protein
LNIDKSGEAAFTGDYPAYEPLSPYRHGVSNKLANHCLPLRHQISPVQDGPNTTSDHENSNKNPELFPSHRFNLAFLLKPAANAVPARVRFQQLYSFYRL